MKNLSLFIIHICHQVKNSFPTNFFHSKLICDISSILSYSDKIYTKKSISSFNGVGRPLGVHTDNPGTRRPLGRTTDLVTCQQGDFLS